MAEGNLKVKVVAVTDTAELERFSAAMKEAYAAGLRGEAQIQEASRQTGMSLDKNWKVVKEQVQATKEKVQETTKETEIFKVSINKAVSEATVLARELATGSFQARTLGSFLSALGGTFTAIAITGIAIVKIFEQWSEQQKKVRDDIAKANEELLKHALLWDRMAANVRTMADLAGVTRSTTAALEDMDRKLDDMSRKVDATSGLRRGLIELLQIPIHGQMVQLLPSPQADKDLEVLKQERDSVLLLAAAKDIDAAKNEEEVQTIDKVRSAITQQRIDLENTRLQIINTAAEFSKYDVEQRKTDPGARALAVSLETLEKHFDILTNKISENEKVLEHLLTPYRNLDGLIREISVDINKMFDAAARQAERINNFHQELADNLKISRSLDNDLVNIEDRANKARDQAIAKSRELGESIMEQTVAGNMAAEAERNKLQHILDNKNAKAGERDAQKQLNDLLRDSELILQQLRDDQMLIQNRPFLGADEKDALLLANLQKYMTTLVQTRDDLVAKRGTLTDALQIDQANKDIQKFNTLITKTGQDIQKMQHPLMQELTQWAAGFGNTWQQVGKSMEGVITTSLTSLNQFLVTGKFNAQQLVQQIALIGLQLLENLAIQQIMALFRRSQAAEVQTEAAATTAAQAPAAAATSIAQYGPIVGGAAAIAAIAAIIAALAVAHEGGQIVSRRRIRRFHSGGLAPGEVPIIAEEGEIIMRRDVAQSPGMTDFLLDINAGRFHKGGGIGGHHLHGAGGHRHHRPGSVGNYQSVTVFTDPGGGSKTPGEVFADMVDNPLANRVFNMFNDLTTSGAVIGFGTNPFGGFGGPMTQSPTWWVQYPGVGAVPMAIPNQPGGWTGDISQLNIGTSRHTIVPKPKHLGGVVSRYHSGGQITGGSVSGGIHIYAFTDLRALTKHMGSKEGQKIIFDTVKGRRIDLGMR